MMKQRFGFGLCVLLLLGNQSRPSEPQVPKQIKFADMQLAITPEAQKAIAQKVHCLVRSPKHYQEIFDRVNLYMPFIERVIQEEGLPEDFKYLAIQESRLIATEISTSNAVGFWQLKQAGATESGVRIDHYIDERMHIVAATRGFARYAKSHHKYFKNWLYALLAFHLGRTGVKPHIEQKYLGAKAMTVDQNTHWYIHHFLAHKLVFEHVIGQERHPELTLYACHTCQGQSLQELSRKYGVREKLLREYNPWLKPGKVPDDAACPVLIPLTHQQYAAIDVVDVQNALTKQKLNYAAYWDKADAFPVVSQSVKKIGKKSITVTCFNAIPGIIASTGDTLARLAEKGQLTLKQFLSINELDEKHRIKIGQVYYFKAKKSKADVHYHIVRPNETCWSIAQKYGMTKGALLSKNRMRKETALKPDQVLWLRFVRPANIPIAYEQLPDQQTKETK